MNCVDAFIIALAEETVENASIIEAFINSNAGPINIDLIGTNLFNREYTDHLSTLKELGYNDSGRNIMINIKVPFKVKN